MLIVFFVTGLWHGTSWNFIVWGLFHGAFLIIERLGLDSALTKVGRPIGHIYTILVVIIGWVFFRADNLDFAFQFLAKMFWISDGNSSVSSYLTFYHWNLELFAVLILGVLFSTPASTYLGQWLGKHLGSSVNILRLVGLMCLFLLCLVYVAGGGYNPFIYFRF